MTELNCIVSGVWNAHCHLIANFFDLFPDGETKDNCSYPKPEIINKKCLNLHWKSLRFVLSEKGSKELSHTSEIIIIEYAPANDNQEETVDVETDFGHPFPFQQRVFLNHDDESEIYAPDYEIPTCPMPHACQEPNGHNIQGLVAAVSTHRDINIVAEE